MPHFAECAKLTVKTRQATLVEVGGFAIETVQALQGMFTPWKPGRGSSAFTFEDLNSNSEGATFGTIVIKDIDDNNGNEKLSVLLEDYFTAVIATDPTNAPNFNSLCPNEAENEKKWRKSNIFYQVWFSLWGPSQPGSSSGSSNVSGSANSATSSGSNSSGTAPKPKPKPSPKPRGWDQCGCCFTAGTQILMADGGTKAIEDVQFGDRVLSYDFDSGKMVSKTVCSSIFTVRENIVDLKLSTDVNISSTTDHPYWVKGKGWCSVDPEMTLSHYKIFKDNNINVSKLEEGDILLLAKQGSNILPLDDVESKPLSTVEIKLSSIDNRESKPTSLWILRVGKYDSDWRTNKKLLEDGRLSGDLSAFYKQIDSMKSEEANPNNHNFFANGILVHNK